MHAKWSLACLFVFILAGMAAAHADMVILKSGEMFQTSKAWKTNGVVHYYRDGQVVRIDAGNVERLIHTQGTVGNPPPPKPAKPTEPAGPSSGPLIGPPPIHPPAVGGDAGYLGLKWGLSPSQIEGLAFVQADPAYGGVKQYRRPKANLRFGRARVDNIFYGFWRNGLYTILIEVSNYMDFMDLKAEVFRRYGEAASLGAARSDKYRWKTGGADRMLSFDHQSDTGYLWMRSSSLHAKVLDQYPD
jgi:hypothetical protein